MFILTCVLIAFILISSYPIFNIVALPVAGCIIIVLMCIYTLFCILKEWGLGR